MTDRPPGQDATSSSSRLLHLCLATHWNPPVKDVQDCVAAGADVLFRGRRLFAGASEQDPVLLQLARRGRVEAVKACLDDDDAAALERGAARPLDLNATGSCQETLLHVLAHESVPRSAALAMLRALVRRLQHRPQDRINWFCLDSSGQHFFSLAATSQLLSAAWAMVLHMPQIRDRLEPIDLRGAVWAWDWAALGAAEQARFLLPPQGLIEAARPTAHLWKLCFEEAAEGRRAAPHSHLPRELPLVEEAVKCVAAGADVLWSGGPLHFSHRPLLSTLLLEGRVAEVRACLQTPRPIDWRCRDGQGNSPLHAVSMGARKKDPTAVRELLLAVLDRLETHHEDVWDWSLAGGGGHTPLSEAALEGHLTTWWRVLQERWRVATSGSSGEKIDAVATSKRRCAVLAYFFRPPPSDTADPTVRGYVPPPKIPLTWPVKRWDWMQLTVFEQLRFELVAGIVDVP